MLMGYLIILGLVLMVVGWLIAEFKASRNMRVSLGLAAIVMITFVASISGTVNSYYTALYHRESLSMIRELLVDARCDAALRIVERYCGRRGGTSALNNAFQLRQELAEATKGRLRGVD